MNEPKPADQMLDACIPNAPLPIALSACFVIAAPIALSWSRPLLMTAALWAVAALFAVLVAPLDVT